MDKIRQRQAAVIRRAVKSKNHEARKALAKHLLYLRKNRKPLEF